MWFRLARNRIATEFGGQTGVDEAHAGPRRFSNGLVNSEDLRVLFKCDKASQIWSVSLNEGFNVSSLKHRLIRYEYNLQMGRPDMCLGLVRCGLLRSCSGFFTYMIKSNPWFLQATFSRRFSQVSGRHGEIQSRRRRYPGRRIHYKVVGLR